MYSLAVSVKSERQQPAGATANLSPSQPALGSPRTPVNGGRGAAFSTAVASCGSATCIPEAQSPQATTTMAKEPHHPPERHVEFPCTKADLPARPIDEELTMPYPEGIESDADHIHPSTNNVRAPDPAISEQVYSRGDVGRGSGFGGGSGGNARTIAQRRPRRTYTNKATKADPYGGGSARSSPLQHRKGDVVPLGRLFPLAF